MKNSFIILTFSALTLFIFSCSKEPIDTTIVGPTEQKINNEISTYDKNTRINENNRNKLAKSIAIAMNDNSFRDFVHNELSRNWGGDIQFLINDVFEVKVTEKLKFKNYLENAGLDNDVKNQMALSRKMRLLATESTYRKLEEQGYNNLLVVEGEGEAKNKDFFFAYKLDGSKVKINAADEPQNPVLIVNSCEICTDEEANKWKIQNDNKIRPRRSTGDAEYIVAFQITKIHNIEGWNYGKPEVKVTCVGTNIGGNAAVMFTNGQIAPYSRSDWENGIIMDHRLFYWHYNTIHGPYYLMKIWEWDDDGNTLTLNLTVPASNGMFSLVYTEIKSGDEQLWEGSFSYLDPDPLYNTAYYETSAMYWHVDAKLP